MRLIDADDFIEKNRELYDQAGWGRREVHFSLADLECNVDMMPSIDAVKHGRWIAQKGGGYCCSECGSYSLDEVDGAFVHVSARTQFCHHCGADMREREEE